jgi:hypothetical protein
VLEAVIAALYQNRKCQALYVQNVTRAMGDIQLEKLVTLLRRRRIWCLNLGENYGVTAAGWTAFCAALPDTHVTHLYVSEHIISAQLKVAMRDAIRTNRSKHTRHCALSNLSVIARCTNMWWNPINTIRHRMQMKLTPSAQSRPGRGTRGRLSDADLTPNMKAYWAESVARAEGPWTFRCKCGEMCE